MIEVVRLKDSGLEREVWEFKDLNNINNTTLVLERYKVQTRKTTRHRWVTSSAWSWHRYDRRLRNMEESEVPFPDEVKEEAVRVLKSLG